MRRDLNIKVSATKLQVACSRRTRIVENDEQNVIMTPKKAIGKRLGGCGGESGMNFFLRKSTGVP